MGKALAVGGLIMAIFNRLAGDEVKAWMPWFTKRLLQIAIERLPEVQRERFSEEWASHVSDVPGEIGKLITAMGCVWAAHEIASTLTHGMPVCERILRRSVDMSMAAVMLLVQAPLFLLVSVLIKLDCGIKERFFVRIPGIGANGKSYMQYRFRIGMLTRPIGMADGQFRKQTRFSLVGYLLFRTGMIKMPTLINVLRGDMAIGWGSATPAPATKMYKKYDSIFWHLFWTDMRRRVTFLIHRFRQRQ